MPEPLSTEKRNQLREAYLEHRNCGTVASICGCSWTTVEKYRIEDQWDKALARIDRLAENLVVAKLSQRRADTIRIAHAAIIKMAKDLDSKDALPWSAQDVDKMARLVELLTGGVDSRPGVERDGPVVILPDNGSDPDFSPMEPNEESTVSGAVDPAVEVPGEPG